MQGYPISRLPKPNIKKKKRQKKRKMPEESDDEIIVHPSKRPRLSRRQRKKLKMAEQKEEKNRERYSIPDEMIINRRSVRYVLSEPKDIDGELKVRSSDNGKCCPVVITMP